MSEKIKWGILGCANIAINKVIPAMKFGKNVKVMAIASRNLEKANAAAEKLNIKKAYGSYDELLSDEEIQAVYIPLPNHMHFEWTKKCIMAGKHVLCEKPLVLKSSEIDELITLRDKYNVKVGEAFMVRTHPQWLKTKEIIDSGDLGNVETINGFFSFYNRDAKNYRNDPLAGGGTMWDIGCYPIFTSRYIYGEEPKRVIASIEKDEEFGIDKLASVIMEFPSGRSTFTASTQLVCYQRMQFFGTKKKLEIRIPFNAPNYKPCKLFIDDGDLYAKEIVTKKLDICDQYTIETNLFSQAIINNTDIAVPLEDSDKNIKVIEAIFESAEQNKWVSL